MDAFNFPALLGELQVFELNNRRKIEVIEYLLQQQGGREAASELPLNHYVIGDIYGRELFIPKGTILTGKIHLFDHLNICDGDISVMTDDGIKRLIGHHVLPSKGGMKRIGYAHEDTTWLTIHALNPERMYNDVESLENQLVQDSDLSWIEESGLLSGDKKWHLQQSQAQP